jgi:hypothetical protein
MVEYLVIRYLSSSRVSFRYDRFDTEAELRTWMLNSLPLKVYEAGLTTTSQSPIGTFDWPTEDLIKALVSNDSIVSIQKVFLWDWQKDSKHRKEACCCSCQKRWSQVNLCDDCGRGPCCECSCGSRTEKD